MAEELNEPTLDKIPKIMASLTLHEDGEWRQTGYFFGHREHRITRFPVDGRAAFEKLEALRTKKEKS